MRRHRLPPTVDAPEVPRPAERPRDAGGLDRRQLLGGLGAAGALAAAGSNALAAQVAPPPLPEANPAAANPSFGSLAPARYLEEVSLADLQGFQSTGRAGAADLVERYLARLEALDRGGPALRSVIEWNPEAEVIAKTLDTERRSKSGARGILHGVPVLVKDNIDSADAMATSAGSLALASHRAAQDAAVVERLRKAGAVLLGKTNLSEWANFRSSRSTSGWSARGGQTRNPYALDRSPCGSSSGSAVAVAASLCAVAVGTETDGSIVCPAAINGIVGLKPTVGLVSRAGIVPIAASQDTAGPMARTVRDCAILLGVLAGEDPRDPATQGAAARLPAGGDYTQGLVETGLQGARLGVARAFFGRHERVDAVIEEALRALRAAGAEVIDPVDLPREDEYADAEYTVLLYEFKAGIEHYLATVDPSLGLRSLADLVVWNRAQREREMPFFGQEIFEAAAAKGPLTDAAYTEALALARRLAREEGIDAVMARHRLDAIVAPTTGPAWMVDPVNGDHYGGGCSTPAAVAGYPHLTVPAGQVFGLPVGLSFFASAWSEPTLLRLGYAFEQATRKRKGPSYRPTVAP